MPAKRVPIGQRPKTRVLHEMGYHNHSLLRCGQPVLRLELDGTRRFRQRGYTILCLDSERMAPVS